MDFFKKNTSKPTSEMIHDAEMENLNEQLKPKRVLLYLHSSLVFIWGLNAFINIFSGKIFVALIHSLCMVLWLAVATMSFLQFRKVKLNIAQKIQKNNILKAQQQDVDSLNFFAKGK